MAKKRRKNRNILPLLLLLLAVCIAAGGGTAFAVRRLVSSGALRTGSSYASSPENAGSEEELTAESTESEAETEAEMMPESGTESFVNSSSEGDNPETPDGESGSAQDESGDGTDASSGEESSAVDSSDSDDSASSDSAADSSAESGDAEDSEVITRPGVDTPKPEIPESPLGLDTDEFPMARAGQETTPYNGDLLIAARTEDSFWEGCPEREIRLLTPNPYSRPQLPLEQVNTIVIHYVSVPDTTAEQNWEAFEGMKTGESRSAGTHFIIGLDGEILQLLPISEVAYATSRRNHDTLSIECCHAEDGHFYEPTYNSLVELTAWLCNALYINPDDVIRHYDIYGKDCPKYYVDHPEAWDQLKTDIKARWKELRS